MKRWLLGAALALPIIGLVAGIAAREAALDDAGEWRIAVTGYDPRDPIRGRYIQFAYAWNVVGDPAQCRVDIACDLCLEDSGGDVIATIRTPGATCANRVDVAQSGIGIAPTGPASMPQFTSRIFVSETSAPALDRALRAGPMVVAARLTRGGRLVNDRLEPAQP